MSIFESICENIPFMVFISHYKEDFFNSNYIEKDWVK